MDMHFETIANDQTFNADLKMPTVNTHFITTIAAPRITAASRRHASTRRFGTITENRRSIRKKYEVTKTVECRSQTTPQSKPNYTTRDEKGGW